MKVHHEIASHFEIERPILTIGTFDGVHLGHQQIIRRLNVVAEENNGESVVLTFHPHPRIVLNPNDHGLELIQPIEKRIEELERLGVDHLILFPFTLEFSRMSATEFVRDVLVNRIGVHTLNIGYDHHFGRNREGSMELIRELSQVYSFNVEETIALESEGVKVSSTKVRKAIKSGDILQANTYLSRAFSFQGRVVTGKGLGKKLGFPTANLKFVSDYQIAPANGVYVIKVRYNGLDLGGIMNVGEAPTISSSNERNFEAHIFDFQDNLYGKIIEILMIDKIRDEKKFGSLEELIAQIKKDEIIARDLLTSYTSAD